MVLGSIGLKMAKYLEEHGKMENLSHHPIS